MTNIITACFGGTHYANTRPAWLIDHGMVLKIEGVELPETYEVDFSNSKAETATRVLGNTDGVVIPDQYFLSNAPQIFAWVYLTTGDSGFTTLQVTIPLSQRPDVSTEPPTPQETDLIEQAIAALNTGVNRAETAAEGAEQSAEEAKEAAENIQQTVEDALQEAKDSGEFDGPAGERGPAGPAGPQGPKGDPGEVTQAEFDELSGEVTDLKSAFGTLEQSSYYLSDKQDTTNGSVLLLENTTEFPCYVTGTANSVVNIIGKNILDVTAGTRQTVANDGTISPSTTSFLSDYIPIVGRSVCASWGEMIGRCAVRIAWYDENKAFIMRQSSSSAEIVQNGTVQRTLPDTYNPKYIRICWDDYTGTNERHLRDLMVELATAKSAYEEYKSQRLTLPVESAYTYNVRTLIYTENQSAVTVDYINDAITAESYTELEGEGDTFSMTVGMAQSGAMSNNRNIAVGYGNLNNGTGMKNMAVGIENLGSATGDQNTAVGYHSQFRTTSGTLNVSVGNESCDDNTIGKYNTGLGAYALQRNSKGEGCTAVGYKALQGASASFDENNKWDYDTAVGYNALIKRTSGYSSTAVGANASSAQTTGNYNTAVGAGALKTNTTGHYNTAVGYNADVNSSALLNTTAIGNGAKATASNQVVIGNSSVDSVIIGGKRILFNQDGTVTWEAVS